MHLVCGCDYGLGLGVVRRVDLSSGAVVVRSQRMRRSRICGGGDGMSGCLF
jgi:hypothetical protein